MKILVVMGSPRKGEGYQVVQKIQAQMQSLGDVEFDTLWLKDADLRPCRGCEACFRFGEQKCPLKDDARAIEARMAAADGIILVTPVYSQHISYLMKLFIDRVTYFWHRPRFFGKFGMTVATGGGQFKETLGYLKQCLKAWGYTWVTQIGAAHPDALVPKMRAKLEREIEDSTRAFYQSVQNGRIPAPSLFDLVWFRVWRINSQVCKKQIPADFEHWTSHGWYERDYYTGQVSAPRRLFARVMEGVLRRVLRGVYVGY
jgi:multimeric flavodoxin WrbA